jgi:hypothetical protein
MPDASLGEKLKTDLAERGVEPVRISSPRHV